MYSSIFTIVLKGSHPCLATIEATLLPGLPSFSISGMEAGMARQTEMRLRAALVNSGFSWPRGRIILSIAPVISGKPGRIYDLPLALALLKASGQLGDEVSCSECVALGELGLDGRLKKISNLIQWSNPDLTLPEGFCLIPQGSDEREKPWIKIPLAEVRDLVEAVSRVKHGDTRTTEKPAGTIQNDGIIESRNENCSRLPATPQPSDPFTERSRQANRDTDSCELPSWILSPTVIEAVTVALAGRHPLLVAGSPHFEIDRLAQWMSTLLPELDSEELYELESNYASCRVPIPAEDQRGRPPFCRITPTMTCRELFGGANPISPGKVCLAHGGILFADHLMQFDVPHLSLLSELLVNQKVSVRKGEEEHCFPSKCLLVAGTEPCACGYLLDGNSKCHCQNHQVRRFWKKYSSYMRFQIPIMLLLNESLRGAQDKDNSEGYPSNQPEIENRIRSSILTCWENQRKRSDLARQGSLFHGFSNTTLNTVKSYWHWPQEVLVQSLEIKKDFQLTEQEYWNLISVTGTFCDLRGEVQIDFSDLYRAFALGMNPERRIGFAEI